MSLLRLISSQQSSYCATHLLSIDEIIQFVSSCTHRPRSNYNAYLFSYKEYYNKNASKLQTGYKWLASPLSEPRVAYLQLIGFVELAGAGNGLEHLWQAQQGQGKRVHCRSLYRTSKQVEAPEDKI